MVQEDGRVLENKEIEKINTCKDKVRRFVLKANIQEIYVPMTRLNTHIHLVYSVILRLEGYPLSESS